MASEEAAPSFEPGQRIRVFGKESKCSDGTVLKEAAPVFHLFYRCAYHGSQHLVRIANVRDYSETLRKKAPRTATPKKGKNVVPTKPAAELPPAKVTKKHTRAAIKEARDADFKDDVAKTTTSKKRAAKSASAPASKRKERDGKCRACSNKAEKCANCHGSGKKSRDESVCAACRGSGSKAFCSRECRESVRAVA